METNDMTATIEAIATAEHPATKEYYGLRNELKTFAKNGNLSAQSLAIFTLARVILNQEESEEDHEIEQRALNKLMRAFTPITNANKLANGRRRWDTLNSHLVSIAGNPNCSQFSQLSDGLTATLKAIAPRLRMELRAHKNTSAS